MKFSVLFLLLVTAASASERIAPESLLAEISAQNPELRFYEAELAAARAGVRLAASSHNPDLSVQAGRKRTHASTGQLAGEGTAWAVSLSQTFEWPGRLALRKAIADRQVDLAELGLARFRTALASRARSLSYGLAAAQEKADAAASVAERFRALKETFLARDPAGLTPLLETRVIEAQELALQRRATETALAAHAALVELNQLRGTAPDTPLRPALPTVEFRVAPTLSELLTAARTHHFEYRARLLELEQQGFAVRLARHERNPAITVSPYLSRESADGRDTIVGLGLSVPLPLSSRSRAGVDLAEARRRQAEAAVGVAERSMEREVLTAVQTFESKRAEAARWSPKSVEKFREAAELADRHYRLGAVPLATYVELQKSYLDAVDALLDTKRETLEAGLHVQLLTGVAITAVIPEAAP